MQEYNLDLDAQTIGGITALMFACESGFVDFARELIKAGANTEIKDRFGRSAEFYAKVGPTIDWPINLTVSGTADEAHDVEMQNH